jgi:hypothetical protein
MIKPKYQNKILSIDNDESFILLGNDISYDSCLEALTILYNLYGWEFEEATGRNPMCRTIDVLKYYAVILSSWMGTTPLNLMVKNSLDHYETKGVIWDSHARVNILFNKNNKQHINTVINELISDIDNILRFKLKNYFDNYYLLLQEKYGKDNSGVNWADFLEYGTSDYQMIELQNIGFSRHLASILLEQYQEYLEFDGEDLLSIDADKVSTLLKETTVEYREFGEVLSLK